MKLLSTHHLSHAHELLTVSKVTKTCHITVSNSLLPVYLLHDVILLAVAREVLLWQASTVVC